MLQDKNKNTALEQISSSLSDSEFIKKTYLQIVKDFDRCNLDLSKNLTFENMNKENLFQWVEQNLLKTLEQQPHKVPQLLYLIDIPEAHIKHNFMDPKVVKESAYIIIVREAQKVYLRTNLNYS